MNVIYDSLMDSVVESKKGGFVMPVDIGERMQEFKERSVKDFMDRMAREVNEIMNTKAGEELENRALGLRPKEERLENSIRRLKRAQEAAKNIYVLMQKENVNEDFVNRLARDIQDYSNGDIETRAERNDERISKSSGPEEMGIVKIKKEVDSIKENLGVNVDEIDMYYVVREVSKKI